MKQLFARLLVVMYVCHNYFIICYLGFRRLREIWLSACYLKSYCVRNRVLRYSRNTSYIPYVHEVA